MSQSRIIPLGDPHNFGKRVSLHSDGRIHKPRTVYWEKLFLGIDSAFVARIGEMSARAGVRSPLAPFPRLRFSAERGGQGGWVERLELGQPHAGVFDAESFMGIGAAIGSALWFGLTDLHADNVAFGTDAGGRLVFGPIDIECVMDQCYLPMQAQLIPAAGMREVDGGLCRLRSLIHEYAAHELVAALCAGFLEAVDFYDKADGELKSAFESAETAEQPIRLILRNTREYYALARSAGGFADGAPLEETERRQLDRGDIPYFFRRFDSSEVLYFAENGVQAPAGVARDKSDRALSLARLPIDGVLVPRTNVEELRKFGVLQIARYFDPAATRAMYDAGRVRIEFDGDYVTMKVSGEAALRCRRIGSKEAGA